MCIVCLQSLQFTLQPQNHAEMIQYQVVTLKCVKLGESCFVQFDFGF